MKWRCDHRSYDCELSNRKLSPKNVFGASRGFEPMASALTLQCSTNWAMKTHTLGAGQFIESIVPVKGMKHMNIIWTGDIQMKWRCDHRSYDCDLSNRKLSPKNVLIPFMGTMNSINWPAPNVWLFIAQLVEHYSANAEAIGSSPVEAPKTFFGLNLRLLKSQSQLRWSHLYFNCMSAVYIIFIS